MLFLVLGVGVIKFGLTPFLFHPPKKKQTRRKCVKEDDGLVVR